MRQKNCHYKKSQQKVYNIHNLFIICSHFVFTNYVQIFSKKFQIGGLRSKGLLLIMKIRKIFFLINKIHLYKEDNIMSKTYQEIKASQQTRLKEALVTN